jgi:hypothetical protein
MFIEGAKDIVANQIHARIPNSSIRRNQWLNLGIDMQSFMNECFGKQTGTSVSGAPTQSVGFSPGDASPQIPQSIFKCLEQVQLEGRMKLRKVFSSRSQIPCEQAGDVDLYDAVPEVESLPRNIDFNPSVNSVNQLISYDSVQMQAMQAANGGDDSMVVTGLQI